MTSKKSRSRKGEARLEAFLARPGQPEGTLTLGELRGFLFALAATPELVKPSEWIPFIFADEEPEFEDMDEAKDIMDALMHLYNAINDDVMTKEPRLPRGCSFLDDPLANLEPEASVSQWSRGFTTGHMWLTKSWDDYVDDERDNKMGMALAPLTFFASPTIAERYAKEIAIGNPSVESLAGKFREVFPYAAMEYAGMGRAIWEAILKEDGKHRGPVVAETPIGRNDPCLCGSGKKFKKCCGASGKWN